MSPRPADDLAHLAPLLAATQEAALAFLEGLPSRPAGRPVTAPAPLPLPQEGVGGRAALALFRERFEAGLSGSAGPRYLGFVTGGTTPAALAGDWLVSAYDQNLAAAGDSVATAVEHEALGMLRGLFGLPDAFEGAFVTGGTQANVVGLATAREWAAERLGVDLSEEGLWALPRIPVLAGAPHSSVLKALSLLGLGRKALQPVPCLPGRSAVDPRALDERLSALGGVPAVVVASAGEVNSGDFDALEEVAALCRRHGAWLHVDGAFGLFAAVEPALAGRLAGLPAADSVAVDAHKWLNVPYDAGVAFTRHLPLQERVFRAAAAYLGRSGDLLHRTPENSRRFRALPAWMALVAYGREGVREVVQRCCALAAALGEALAASPHFELLSPVHLNVTLFALREGDAARRDRLLAWLKADGRVLLTPTQWQGRPAVRAAFSSWRTGPADLPVVLAALEAGAAAV
jgi:glutamate/tyrosine decarboxylase-like PLP-dependent enzyme